MAALFTESIELANNSWIKDGILILVKMEDSGEFMKENKKEKDKYFSILPTLIYNVAQDLLLVVHGRPYIMLGSELRSVVCKAYKYLLPVVFFFLLDPKQYCYVYLKGLSAAARMLFMFIGIVMDISVEKYENQLQGTCW